MNAPEDKNISPRPPERDNGASARLTALADRPIGTVILVVLALLEATVFPGPTEAMLIALTLGRRQRVIWYASVATLASVVGAVGGYFLGATVFADVVEPLLRSYGLSRYMDAVGRLYAGNMLLALSTSGYTPVPYMLYTSMAGAAQLPFVPFIVGSFLGRALKYVPIAVLTYILGPRVHWALRRYGPLAAVLIGGGLLVYFLL